MDTLISWLGSSAFTLLATPVSWVEVIAFVTGAACVWGVARQKLWNWPVGIANNLAFIMVFLGAGLYGETLLQVIFAAIAVYGWIKWRAGADQRTLPIRDARRPELVAGLTITVLATAAIAYLLHAGTDSQVPIPDAFVLAASLVATYGQAQKIFQHWYLWIVIDLVSIPLYFSRGLILTGILYLGFLALCLYGLRHWHLTRAAQAATPHPTPVGA